MVHWAPASHMTKALMPLTGPLLPLNYIPHERLRDALVTLPSTVTKRQELADVPIQVRRKAAGAPSTDSSGARPDVVKRCQPYALSHMMSCDRSSGELHQPVISTNYFIHGMISNHQGVDDFGFR